MKTRLKIRQATSKGYVEVEEGGVFDFAYPTSLTRRGRVEDGGRICPTITSSGGCQIAIYLGYEQGN